MAPGKTKAISLDWLKRNLLGKLGAQFINSNSTLKEVCEHIKQVDQSHVTVSYNPL